MTDITTTKTWRFRALDTWFFRESRPMESVGGSELVGNFPPSPRTLAGAIRHIVGNRHEVDWKEWGKVDTYPDLKQRMGDANGYGGLRLSGAWLAREVAGGTERLYPVPGNLVVKWETIAPQSDKTDKTKVVKEAEPEVAEKVLKLARLQVGKPRRCNLGEQVRMPVLPKDQQGMRGADDYWVTERGLQKILRGGVCQVEDLVAAESLFNSEARLGIAINNRQRAVEESLLYQTRHVRPEQSVMIEVDVSGLNDDDHDSEGIVRLGGEGRAASWSVHDSGGLHTAAIDPGDTAIDHAKGIILVLLTPADLYPEPTGSGDKKAVSAVGKYTPLPGFKPVTEKGATVWKGVLYGIELTLHCAIMGKPVREGGWDLVNNSPRAVRSLVPAGSVFYLTVDKEGGIGAVLLALSGKQIPEKPTEGQENEAYALGRGLVAVGLWPENEYESIESVEKE